MPSLPFLRIAAFSMRIRGTILQIARASSADAITAAARSSSLFAAHRLPSRPDTPANPLGKPAANPYHLTVTAMPSLPLFLRVQPASIPALSPIVNAHFEITGGPSVYARGTLAEDASYAITYAAVGKLMLLSSPRASGLPISSHDRRKASSERNLFFMSGSLSKNPASNCSTRFVRTE
jgi:hypothetical protein